MTIVRKVLAWGALTLTLTLVAGALALAGAGASQLVVWFDAVLIPAQAVAFATVGLLVALRRPENRIGWLFSLVGLFVAAYSFAFHYQRYGLVTAPGALPYLEEAAWLQAWLYVPALGMFFTFVPLLFPTGRPPSPRWRPVAWLAAAGLAAVALSDALRPGPIDQAPSVVNPFGIEPAAHTILEIVALPGLFLPATLLSVAALLMRWRRGSRDERQQLKWFASAAMLLPIASITWGAVHLSQAEGPAIDLLEHSFATVTFLGMPIGTGIAILRHRLYDIDRIVSRTVTYGVVTALLGGLYLIGVLALGRLLAPVTEGSQLAVAGSTLAVAAAFGPVRRRVQTTVDRRFNRARYDAGVAVAGFRDRLRDAIELDQLSAELLGTVDTTVQPARAWLWLAPPRGQP